jgi:hypothetical protein
MSNVTIAKGQKALVALVSEVSAAEHDWNEAETRLKIIDRLIRECLGWTYDQISVEKAQDRKYTDYELGTPRALIVEAKREGIVFELPADPSAKLIQDLASVAALDPRADEAIKQAQQYATLRGVEFAAVSNGHQLIAFLASRFDGIPPLEDKCLIVRSFDQMLDAFPKIWQNLSPSGIAEKKLFRLLTVGQDTILPPKLCTYLTHYQKFRYGSPLQASLSVTLSSERTS